MVRRRKVLVGIGMSIALAGCSGETETGASEGSTNEPTQTPTEEPTTTLMEETATATTTQTSTPTTTTTPTSTPSNEIYQTAFEETLNSEFDQASVRAVEPHQDNMVLEYETRSAETDVLSRQIAQVAAAFAAGVAEGWDVEYLFAYIYVPNESSEIGSFQIHREDAAGWMDDELSSEEYLSIVLESLEVYE